MPPPPAHAAGRGRRAGSAALKPLTLSDWGTALFICLLFITACLAAVLAIHLNLTSRRSGEPILSVRGTADAADAAGDAAGTPSSGLGAGQQGTAGVDAAVGATAGWEAEPPRLSDQAEALSEAELHGGWSLTWEVRGPG